MYIKKNNIRKKEKYVKGKPIPLIIIIDTSESMKDFTKEINECICRLFDRLKKSLSLRNRTYVLVLKYNSEVETPIYNFTALEEINPNDIMVADDDFKRTTNTGAAILDAFTRWENKYEEWLKYSTEPTMCLTFLLTDGALDAGDTAPRNVERQFEEAYQNAAEAIKEHENNENLFFVAGGIQNGVYAADIEKLCELSDHEERIIPMLMGDEETNQRILDKFFDLIHECTKKLATGSSSDDLDKIIEPF